MNRKTVFTPTQTWHILGDHSLIWVKEPLRRNPELQTPTFHPFSALPFTPHHVVER